MRTKRIAGRNYDYCPRCRMLKEHLIVAGIKMCKTCMHQKRSQEIQFWR